MLNLRLVRRLRLYFQNVNVQLMGAYMLGGLGYDIKSGNMYFIEKDTTISNY